MVRETRQELQPFSLSLEEFCRLVEYSTRQTGDPQLIAAVCETQAEALRIDAQDAGVESLDLLLNTLLNTLQHISDAQKQKRWGNRVKALFRNRTIRKPGPVYAAGPLLRP